MKSGLRVLHVLNELKPSGAETMFCIAAPLFAEAGVEAEIVATGPRMGIYAPQLAAAGYKLHHIPLVKSPGFFFKLFRLMRQGHYNILHLHTEQANFWIGLTALAARPRRVLQTIHNSFAFNGSLRLRRMIQRRILRALGVVHVSISPSVMQTELRHFGLKTRLVTNWYDNERFVMPSESERRQARNTLGIEENDTVIVSIGNCSLVKNHGALLEALARLPATSRPLYLHVGIEEPDHPERKLARDLGITDRVRFFGALQDVQPILYAADIFAMPSLFEGFGIAAVEALGTGLTALFTDVAGLKDFRNHYDGLQYAKTDAASLYLALMELLTESSLQRRARAWDYMTTSRRLYGMRRGVDGYLEIYRGY